MQIDQRKKLELLDYRMRNQSQSPIQNVNNFANIKSKLNGIETYKNGNQQAIHRGNINNEDEDDERVEQNYFGFENNNNEESFNFMKKNIHDFNGENYLFCTPPVKMNNNATKQSILYNNFNNATNNQNAFMNENEDDNLRNKEDKEENESESESIDDEELNEENDYEEDSEQEQIDNPEKTGSYHSQNKEKNIYNHEHGFEKPKLIPSQKPESYEPQFKKGRVLNSQKILFQENTLPNGQEKKSHLNLTSILSTSGGDAVKKCEEVKGMNQIAAIQSKANIKNNLKNQKKVSKITDYLNQDLIQKNGGNNIISKSTGNSNNTDNEFIYQLQNDLKQKDTLINQKQKQIENLEQQINKLKQNQPNNKIIQNANGQPMNSAQDHNKIKKIIQKQFVDNSILQRKLIKMQLQQSKQRLGEYIVDLSNFREQWIDGFEVQELYNQLKLVEKKISHYSSIYQSLKNQKPNKKTQCNGKQQKLQTISCTLNDPLNQANSNQDSNSKCLLSDDEEFDTTIYPNQAVAHEEQKRFKSFQISLLEKQREVINQNLEQKKKEVKEIIKKYQLQYLEENSRYGGLQVENPWPVLGNRYQLLSLLGKGGFSEVYKAIDLEEFREVAVKIHYIDKSWSNSTKQNYLKHAFREHGIQKELDHPNIVKLYDYIEIDSNSFASVLQFCEGPDLSQHLKIHSSIIEQDAKYIVKKILECLEYLNSFQSKVIHYDLKPQNIIFNKGQIKITDFGLSKIIEDNATRLELTSQGVGTYWYLPPECFESFGSDDEQAPQISSKVDIWSVGVIFYEMLFGQKPFGHKMSQQQILQQNTILNSKEVKFPKKPIISKEAQSFILGCLKHNQEERFDIKLALNHPYFKKQ